MVHEALAAADAVAGDGISVEVIDLRTVAPLDTAPILESVARTSRLLIAHEAVVPFGIGAEIAAVVAREAFWDLDAPIERVGAAPTPPPYAPDLERAWLPDRDDIAAALRRLAENAPLRARLTEAGAALCDGRGTQRTVRAIAALAEQITA
jgi:2-oxoisovalerate dehydrogenase E1 component